MTNVFSTEHLSGGRTAKRSNTRENGHKIEAVLPSWKAMVLP